MRRDEPDGRAVADDVDVLRIVGGQETAREGGDDGRTLVSAEDYG